jgi:hypothetical protein
MTCAVNARPPGVRVFGAVATGIRWSGSVPASRFAWRVSVALPASCCPISWARLRSMTSTMWSSTLCEAMLHESSEWLLARRKSVSLLLMPQTRAQDEALFLHGRRLSFAAARGPASGRGPLPPCRYRAKSPGNSRYDIAGWPQRGLPRGLQRAAPPGLPSLATSMSATRSRFPALPSAPIGSPGRIFAVAPEGDRVAAFGLAQRLYLKRIEMGQAVGFCPQPHAACPRETPVGGGEQHPSIEGNLETVALGP